MCILYHIAFSQSVGAIKLIIQYTFEHEKFPSILLHFCFHHICTVARSSLFFIVIGCMKHMNHHENAISKGGYMVRYIKVKYN